MVNIILNPERLGMENVNCWSVCPVSHWLKKLTNQILVLVKLSNQVRTVWKLTNQVSEPLLMSQSYFSVMKTNVNEDCFAQRR
jgi:hypothetical protein